MRYMIVQCLTASNCVQMIYLEHWATSTSAAAAPGADPNRGLNASCSAMLAAAPHSAPISSSLSAPTAMSFSPVHSVTYNTASSARAWHVSPVALD
jgi:hypothetical protein